MLCGTCHRWVHDNPFEARRQGWIVSRYANPYEEPAYTSQYGMVVLNCEGGYDLVAPEEVET